MDHRKPWKVPKRWEYETPPDLSPEKLVCRSRSNSWNQTWAGSKLGKEYDKTVCCHPAYLTYMQLNKHRTTARLESQAGIKIAGRSINNLRYADDTTLMAEGEEELKGLLMRVNKESEKAGLKFNI